MSTCTGRAESLCCSDSPAPTKLEIPPHRYLNDNRQLIGSDEAA